MARVLVVDDDAFTLILIENMIESLGHVVVGRASSVTAAMEIAIKTKPEIALLDLDLGEGPTGLDLAYGLRKVNPSIGLVMLTSYADPTWMGQRRPMPPGMRYLVKGQLSEKSKLGEALIDSLKDSVGNENRSVLSQPLSEGQFEILRLVAYGYSNSEIAKRRHLTDGAVNKAVTRLVNQLNLSPTSSDNVRVLLAQKFFRMTGQVSERRD